MRTIASENWVGCSPALLDAIMCINLMLKNRGIKAECNDIYLQYRKFDGFALNIVGEKLDDETVAQCQLQFKNDYSDYNEYPHQYVFGRGCSSNDKNSVTTQLFVVENDEFYVLDEDDTREEYRKDWLASLPAPEPLEYESIFDPIFKANEDNNFNLDEL